MAVKNIMLPIPLTIFAATGLSANYALINGPDGSPFPLPKFRIINASNEDITISYDGVNDHDFIGTATSIEINLQNNARPNNFMGLLAKGTKIYAKATAAGTGNIYVAGWYQPEL